MPDLRTEARVFARYLVDSDLSDELVDRYLAANELLFAHEEDDGSVAFATRHPWSLPMLDAAAGLRAGSSLLRKKLLVMTAIVETTPEYVEKTEPRAVSVPKLAWRVGVAGARTAMHAATGLALLAWVKRRD